jgi:hypothetical protein
MADFLGGVAGPRQSTSECENDLRVSVNRRTSGLEVLEESRFAC